MERADFIIQSVRAKLLEVPLSKDWQISLYSAKWRQHLVVEVTSKSGIKGLGEASPAPAFMGEYGASMLKIIEDLLAPALVNLNALDIEKIHAIMNSIIHDNMSSKAAIDIALHDLLGKALGVPVYGLLGGKYHESIPLTWVIGIKSSDEVLKEAQHYVDQGYKTIKIKLGRSPSEDLNVVRNLRKNLGENIAIRVDANQAYTFDQAVRLFKRMEEYEIESIEQPLPAWDLDGMKKLAEMLDTPVMADEAVFSPEDALRVIKERAADIINIKVGKVGGLSPAKKIAAIAQAAGIACTVGSNLELGIGISASLHLALATPMVSYPCDLFIGLDLHQRDIAETSIDVTDGMAATSADSGLGVRLKKEGANERSEIGRDNGADE